MLSNNTAHITLCNSNFVYPVSCPIIEKSMGEFVGDDTGNWFRVDVNEAAQRLIKACNEIYDLELIEKRKNYAKTFSLNNLKPLYQKLICPKSVKLSSKNFINENGLFINDIKLYEKFKKINYNE